MASKAEALPPELERRWSPRPDRKRRLAPRKNDSAKIIPGHGPLSTKKDLVAYRDMLKTIRGRIQTQVTSGKSLDEVKASRPTKDWDETLGKGFINGDQLTEFIYTNLKAKK